MLLELNSVDEVIPYDTEEDLVLLLQKLSPAVRILGSDYEGRAFTGDHLSIPIHYHKRDHDWSTTRLVILQDCGGQLWIPWPTLTAHR